MTSQVGSTQSITLHSAKVDFRYLYTLNAYNSASAIGDCTGYIQNVKRIIDEGMKEVLIKYLKEHIVENLRSMLN
jgi:hypothetical protein